MPGDSLEGVLNLGVSVLLLAGLLVEFLKLVCWFASVVLIFEICGLIGLAPDLGLFY